MWQEDEEQNVCSYWMNLKKWEDTGRQKQNQ